MTWSRHAPTTITNVTYFSHILTRWCTKTPEMIEINDHRDIFSVFFDTEVSPKWIKWKSRCESLWGQEGDKEIPYFSSKCPKNNIIYDKNWQTLVTNRSIFCQGVIRFLKRCTGACKYASKRLKADVAAQPKGCSACFVPVLQKMQINRLFTLSPKSRNHCAHCV